MKKAFSVIGAALVIASVFATAADADGRVGSQRLGGYTSHGQGSHYYGGYNRP